MNQKSSNLRIAIACGGTGGHIFPGLATAQVLKDRGHEVELWLSGRDIEEASIADWDGRIISVKACGFPTRVSLKCIPIAWTLWRCFINCRWMMRKSKPDVILAMGSYASVGPVLAARSLGVPVVLHEANAIPGRAIGFLSRFAAVVAVSFADAANHLKNAKTDLTGFPVRKEIQQGKGISELTVLIMGGSQGAHRINEVAIEAMALLKGRGLDFSVIHIAGRTDEEMVGAAYKRSGVSATVHAFTSDMNEVYAAATLAVCRSGAASCSELAIAGVPALFIPLPTSMYNHQFENARAFAKSGAADVLEQNDLTPVKLADYIESCGKDPQKLADMKKAMLELACPDSTDRLADLVEETALGQPRQVTGDR